MKNSHRLAAFSLAAALAAAAGPLAGAQAPEAPAASPAEASSLPLELRLTPGQIRTLPVQRVERVAVGDPAIADVTIVTPDQLLIKAKQLGATNFIVWDSSGQHEMQVQVQLSASPEALSADVQQLLRELGLTSVRLHPQFGKIFLLGTVESDAKLVALEQAIAAFGDGIVNLVSVAPPIDVLAPLVSLSVQVLEISREDVNQLGVNWSDSFSLTESAMPVSSPRDQLLRIGEMTQRSVLAATVSALVTHNKARILSEPKLVTSSGKPASSFIGLEVPIISTSSVGSTGTNVSIEFRQTGVLLEMTPTVTDEREEITIKMKAEVSSIDTASGLQVPVGSTTVLVPGFRSRSATTEVAARSGETIVIAGLLQASDEQAVDQVPGLGDMPVLGRLFRSPVDESAKRELVITITPELLGDPAEQAEHGQALERALSVAEVTASVDDPKLRYALSVQGRIAQAIRYPQREKELGMEGTVKLKLHLFADGTLGRVVVSQSSGLEALDTEALKAAETQAPYQGFPSELADRELWLEIPIIFRP